MRKESIIRNISEPHETDIEAIPIGNFLYEEIVSKSFFNCFGQYFYNVLF